MPEVVCMDEFEKFYRKLVDLAEKFEKSGLLLKIEGDLDNSIIKIFGEKTTSLTRAQSGLGDISELAYATSEHHPYWNLLYNNSEITSTVLDKWQSSLSEEDLDDIDWAIQKINRVLEKIRTKNS